jgi:hypothetical protein
MGAYIVVLSKHFRRYTLRYQHNIREALHCASWHGQIDTCATSQNWLVKYEPEGRYSAGARD